MPSHHRANKGRHAARATRDPVTPGDPIPAAPRTRWSAPRRPSPRARKPARGSGWLSLRPSPSESKQEPPPAPPLSPPLPPVRPLRASAALAAFPNATQFAAACLRGPPSDGADSEITADHGRRGQADWIRRRSPRPAAMPHRRPGTETHRLLPSSHQGPGRNEQQIESRGVMKGVSCACFLSLNQAGTDAT